MTIFLRCVPILLLTIRSINGVEDMAAGGFLPGVREQLSINQVAEINLQENLGFVGNIQTAAILPVRSIAIVSHNPASVYV
jgi:hypothetical protein